MSTRVFLVRHGATELTAEDRFAGSTDVALSDVGRGQLGRLGERLSRDAIAAVYASPLSRTMESARIVSASHGKPIVPLDGLREIDHGRWEKRTRAEVEELFPDEYACWEADPFTFAPQGGESGLQVMARALPALRTIVESNPDATVLVLSHKATIRLLLSALLGFDPRTYRDRLDQSPACLNILDFKGPTKARLSLFNDVSHYASSASSTPETPGAHLSKWWDGGTRDKK